MPPNIPTPPIPPARPPTDTSAQPTTVGDEDPLSPTVMLQSYLRSKGIMPGSAKYGQNMMQLLQENARGSVDIPGLVNQAPSTDPGVGQSGNVAASVEKAPTGARNAPVNATPTNRPQGADTPLPPNAPVAPGTSGSGFDLASLLGPAILGGASVGTGYWLGGRNQPGARPGDVPALGANAAPAAPQAAPAPVQTGDRFDVTPPPPQGGDMQAALAKAMAPAAGMQPSTTGAATSISPELTPDVLPRPPGMPNRVNAPPDVLPRPPMPSRVNAPPMPPIVPPTMVPTPGGGLTTPGGGFTRPPIVRSTARPRLNLRF